MRFSYPAATILLAWAIMALVPSLARADDAQLFHATSSTVGCADAATTRALTNPNEARRNNPTWVKNTFADGRCVSVTTKSPWRFVSRDGDVAMMDYAGTIGPPGSYYFSIALMIDPNGYHPGDVAAPAPVTTGPDAAKPATDETALAPKAPPPLPVMQPTDGLTPGFQPTPDAAAPSPWTLTNILLLVIALGLAALCGFLFGRRA